ncbi:hypothetical protein [Planktothrix mougeotii]|uniref:Uncharacterized protein n=1 Tax=Planktothrix mougeotii LEGE 06226 TaxID=1828728 RepID=A0ABR9UKX0_9CYAN|nr:hypothetical protein [Planktothrix mougeotii]MBE9146446.1 hypothetical protein [Planktothrix mougeotii LEGE 06226]
MPSLEVREFAEKINQLSLEDKQWLLRQLMQQVTISNNSDLNPSNSLTNEVKKIFNLTPAVPGSGYPDTAINHDQIIANTLLGES